MADTLSPIDKQTMVSSFLEIAVGQTTDTAHQFLLATSWRLEEAIQLFFVGNERGLASSSSSSVPPVEDEVRAPLPVITESLYGRNGASRYDNAPRRSSSVVAFRNFDEEMEEPEVGGTSTAERSPDNLAALYRPPFALMYQGSFEQAKFVAASEDKWLIVNVQSNKEFTSHTLNRDTWANEGVAQTIQSNFIFWQVYDDTTEGMKVCTYYKVSSTPVTIIIDPITGQKMRLWSGMVHPDPLLEVLLPLMDNGPHRSHKRPRKASPSPAVSNDEDEELRRAIATSMEGVVEAEQSASEDKPEASIDSEVPQVCSYPPLPDEPKGDKSLLCRVGFRLPDGRRVQRNFLRSDPIQLMWSFCYSQIGEDKARAFRLVQAMPGSSNSVDYDRTVTIGESGLSNSMISVAWV